MGINTQNHIISIKYRNTLNSELTMTEISYEIKEVDDKRWGIYLQGRLLATVGSYEACKSIGESLNKENTYADMVKATIAYKKAINKSLIIR